MAASTGLLVVWWIFAGQAMGCRCWHCRRKGRSLCFRVYTQRNSDMRKKLVAGNWKMHGSRSMAMALVGDIVAALPSAIDVAVFPPFPYLGELAIQHAGSGLGFGAQDVSEHDGQGAYTGDVSAAMLADVGAQWVLVGHSERRQHHHETDRMVAHKFAAA